MSVNKKVQIGWQVIFTLIPFVNFWAFARIRKFKQFLLYLFLPQLVINIVLWMVKGFPFSGILPHPTDENGLTYPKPPLPSYMVSEPHSEEIFDFLFNNFTVFDRITDVMMISFILFSIYLIIRWSKQWNKKLENEN